MLRVIPMPNNIVESDLKELFVLCDSQQALIEIQEKQIESLEKRIDSEHNHYVYGYEKLEKRINNIELLLTQQDNT